MKSVPVISVAAIMLAVAIGACLAEASSDTKRAIQVVTTKAMHLIMNQEFKALARLCTPNCTFTENGRTLNVKQVEATLKAEFAQMKDVKMSSTIVTCETRGRAATCTSKDVMAAKIMGADKKWHKMTSEGTSSETFVKKGGTWLMTSNATISEKITMDGKPFDPTAATGGAAAPTR